jgi:hypothetical protein
MVVYVSPNNPDGAMGAWWNAGGTLAVLDVAGKMKFDLNGAANYNHYENKQHHQLKEVLYWT